MEVLWASNCLKPEFSTVLVPYRFCDRKRKSLIGITRQKFIDGTVSGVWSVYCAPLLSFES